MITVYTIAYNESVFIQFMIDHYRSKFPNCHIVVYDNCSTDNTIEIATNNNCEIRTFNTYNQIDDLKYLEIKNNCWKDAKTDWVLICDIDELVNINEQELREEERQNTNIIQFEGYNMINAEDNLDLSNIKLGIRHRDYDKKYLFNKKFIQEINYNPGCHQSCPTGSVKMSAKTYLAFHYRYIGLSYTLNRYKMYSERLSLMNKNNFWGSEYEYSEDKIRSLYQEIKGKAKKLLP